MYIPRLIYCLICQLNKKNYKQRRRNMSDNRKINLFVKGKTAYIWTPQDWELMRNNRVVGNFVGNLASLPRQDFREGLPLALLPEEATLLTEKGLALFREFPSLAERPSNEVRDRGQAFRHKILSEQVDLLKDSRKRDIEKNIKLIVKGKKVKRNISELDVSEEQLEKEILQEEIHKIQDPKTSSLSLQIFTGDPWIDLEESEQSTWKYPDTEESKIRYLTYKDLWERGYFVTSGSKFGADYLVYPGDPVLFHSFFTVKCIHKKQELTSNEIIAYGRLGQSVRKTFVLAYLSDNDSVNYQSIQWTGH